MCRASACHAELFWTNCCIDAGWRATRFSDASYREYTAMMGLPVPLLLVVMIGLKLANIMVDSLHAMELGWAAHIIGNIMWETITNHSWGRPNQDENTKALEVDMIKWYKAEKVTSRVQGTLNKERIRADGEYPKLRAKAAAIRHLAPYALILCIRFNSGSLHDQRKLGVAQLLVRYYEILKMPTMFLPSAVAAELAQLVRDMGVLYHALYHEAHVANLRLWKMTPKIHLCIHLGEEQAGSFGNPSYFWCYADEDLIGLMTETAESLHVRTLAPVLMVKWLVIAFDAED